MRSNSQRILGQIVAIEAWYDRFSEENPTSDLNVQIAFKEAFIGGLSDERVSFKVKLKRAEIRVLIDEGIKVDRKSVWRPRTDGNVESIATQEKSLSGKLSANANANPTNFAVGASAEGDASAKNSQRTEVKISSNLIGVEHTYHEGANTYECAPATGTFLKGHVIPLDTPIMRLQSVNPKSAIAPSIKLRVSCRREDLDISDIRPKDKALIDRLPLGIGRAAKESLAIEVIKDTLSEVGLKNGDLSHEYSIVVVADVLAQEE